MANRKAFTLVELLVVISIIGLLMAVLLPALTATRDNARKIVCATQVRQIGMALNLYATDNRGWFPMVMASGAFVFHSRDDQGSPNQSVAPYLSNGSTERTTAVVKTLMCPNSDSSLSGRTVTVGATRHAHGHDVSSLRRTGDTLQLGRIIPQGSPDIHQRRPGSH